MKARRLLFVLLGITFFFKQNIAKPVFFKYIHTNPYYGSFMREIRMLCSYRAAAGFYHIENFVIEPNKSALHRS